MKTNFTNRESGINFFHKLRTELGHCKSIGEYLKLNSKKIKPELIKEYGEYCYDSSSTVFDMIEELNDFLKTIKK